MSKNITISEGENARAFGNTKKLKTLLQGGDAEFCFWVPEDETQANPTYISENGMHTAAEAKEYGFSVAHVNVPAKLEDLDGNEWDVLIDEDGIPHIEIDDLDVEITIDDDTGEVNIITDEQEITIDPEDFDLDPDADIDVSIDVDDFDADIVSTDLDGDDVLVDLDLETLDFETEDCPASIVISHVPEKTSYRDGEAIDYDGLMVQALNKDGTPWSSADYPDGYIPVHELNMPKYTDDCTFTSGQVMINGDIPAAAYADGAFVIHSGSGDYYTDPPRDTYVKTTPPGGVVYLNIVDNYVSLSVQPSGSYTLVIYRTADKTFWGINYFGVNIARAVGVPESTTVIPENIETVEETTGIASVPVNWESPCFKTLSAAFDISVTPKKPSQHSQTTHGSGKF